MTRTLIVIATSSAILANAAAAEAKSLAFVACPIVQDTPSVPCWLSEYEGELYYMGVQSDVSAPFNPPWLGHMALIEGTPDPAGTRICGGIVLGQVKASAMPEMSPECGTLLPAKEGYILPFEPLRPPGPSSGQLAFTPPPPPPAPEPPFVAKTFDIYFPFEGTVNFQTPGALREVQAYAEQVGATRIDIVGQRATVRLSNGTMLEESEGLAEKRAGDVARMFQGLIATVQTVTSKALEQPVVGDWSDRKVSISVVP